MNCLGAEELNSKLTWQEYKKKPIELVSFRYLIP
jgi:hypothetical protein